MSPPKSCAVCGDKALGYNFNAVTCESCKAFFRRNALAKKQFTCPFNQNCDITVVTRRFCQKCRLKKCMDIGMKSENIMSEEDKLIKRRKIESNRAKRRLNDQKVNVDNIKHEQQAATDSSGYDAASHDSRSCGSFDSGQGQGSTEEDQQGQPSSSGRLLNEPMPEVNTELMTSEEIVEFIVSDPDRASQAISKLMRTTTEAMATLEKVINSQKDALRLIEHLIAYPGDALKIISKIMNSPLNALTVFTQFMSSPTDALEIISKIVSSPQDVLQFIRNLMDSPEDALDIMNKFMNTPAEALKMINKIFNGTKAPTPAENTFNTPMDSETASFKPTEEHSIPVEESTLIHSMLNNSPSAAVRGVASPHRQQQQTPKTLQSLTEFTPSPQPMSLTSPPASIAASDSQYHSPTSMPHDELPNTSANSTAAAAADFPSENFDRCFMQNSFTENPHVSAPGDSLSSLESVLTEVIRIEFQAFNNLPPEARVKQEQFAMQLGSPPPQESFIPCSKPSQPICAPSSLLMSRNLNETEQMKLQELKLASEALYYPIDNNLSMLEMGDDRIKPEDSHQDPKLLQVINLTAVAIKRLIKMAKKITAFRDMCQEDQVALLKGGCTEMMIMRSVMTYDGDRHFWKIPHTKENMFNIRADVLKLAKGNLYEEHLKFMHTFDEKWRMDENIILIMCAIVLFTPTRSRIIHSDVIRLEQNSYYYLLRRYLESVYPGCEAKSAFIKLIQKISDVERLNRVIIGVYLNVNPSLVEPLLREIFDLKNH